MMFNKFKTYLIAGFALFCALLLAIVAFLNIKMQEDSRTLLESSVRSQLIAICVAAREAISPAQLLTLNTEADTKNNPAYDETLEKLRQIASAVGAKYIYILRHIGGEYLFIYDTDTEDTTAFTDYEISPVHAEAFRGAAGADIMNVKDEYGSFSTGAAPIWHEGKIVGIVSADIEDKIIAENLRVARLNAALLIGAIVVTMLATALVLGYLLRRVKEMQDKLTQMAHYDPVTGLPNRQYLLEYLAERHRNGNDDPFALYFIDLDNFKTVNDVAGHDAGDALLRRIGAYLGKRHGANRNSKVFRPSAGRLNVAARIGGDEFIIVIPDIDSVQAAGKVANDILEGFRKEDIDGHIQKYNVGLSIGVALCPSQSEDYNVLIKYADIAMYHAKKAGKNRYRIYDDELPDKVEK